MARADLAVIAAGMTLACVVPYLRDVRRGETRPQRASWFVFATLGAVAAVSQALTGNTAGTWLAAGSAVGFGAVFVASIRRGVGGFAARDRTALAVAVVGTTVSVVTARPLMAVVGVVLAEMGAVGLTVRKALDDPGSETRSTWITDGFAGLLGIAAVDRVTTTALLYPVHHTVANGAVVAAIAIGRRRAIAASRDRPNGRTANGWPEQAHERTRKSTMISNADRERHARVATSIGTGTPPTPSPEARVSGRSWSTRRRARPTVGCARSAYCSAGTPGLGRRSVLFVLRHRRVHDGVVIDETNRNSECALRGRSRLRRRA